MWYTEQEKRDEIRRITLEYLEMGYGYEEAKAEAEREWRRMFESGDEEGADESEPPPLYIVRRGSAGESGVVTWTPKF